MMKNSRHVLIDKLYYIFNDLTRKDLMEERMFWKQCKLFTPLAPDKGSLVVSGEALMERHSILNEWINADVFTLNC